MKTTDQHCLTHYVGFKDTLLALSNSLSHTLWQVKDTLLALSNTLSHTLWQVKDSLLCGSSQQVE